MVFWAKGAFWRNCSQIFVRPLFLVLGFFFVVDTRPFGGEVCLFGICGLVEPDIRVRILIVSFKVIHVGGWLTHGDLVLGAEVDFLAIVEHRLIPARVRGEWARLRRKVLATVWAPASQDTSHVGHAGVGVVSLKSAPISLLSFAI